MASPLGTAGAMPRSPLPLTDDEGVSDVAGAVDALLVSGWPLLGEHPFATAGLHDEHHQASARLAHADDVSPDTAQR